MKHLIIYTHLNPNSFTKAVVNEVEKISNDIGHETKIIDLYGDKFNPVLEFSDIEYSFMDGEAPTDVKHYQDKITWAEHITFVYPLWWGQMPAMLKGFIDRVFAHGYAYTYDENGPKGLLNDKSVQLIINTGNPNKTLSESGLQASMEKIIDDGVFGFCGMESKVTFFGNISLSTDEERKQHLDSVKNLVV